MRVSLRAKVILVALVLSVIPLVGYLHVMEMERLLREGQEQALLATARAIATALHDRPQLLDVRPDRPASFGPSICPSRMRTMRGARSAIARS